MYLGGFTLDTEDANTIESVEAISLFYFLDTTEEWMVKRGSSWEAAFLATVKEARLPNLRVYRFTSLTLEQELEENTNSVLPYFALNIGIMIIFCILTCMMTDWVKSKPLLGLLGVASAILASVTAFGLVMYLGMDFIGINLAAPFLMLGIGIDDTFVLLAAWRRTSPHDSVPSRMGQTYREAAVSITITSVTDMLSFWIGVITPFPCVRIFSVYTGACVVFTYFWHLTFFGGCMAVAGYAEKQNRHALTCCPVTPKSQAGQTLLHPPPSFHSTKIPLTQIIILPPPLHRS
jgi:predicted RND superfamily exporter protein